MTTETHWRKAIATVGILVAGGCGGNDGTGPGVSTAIEGSWTGNYTMTGAALCTATASGTMQVTIQRSGSNLTGTATAGAIVREGGVLCAAASGPNSYTFTGTLDGSSLTLWWRYPSDASGWRIAFEGTLNGDTIEATFYNAMASGTVTLRRS